MPDSSLVSEFTSAKSYSVGSFNGSLWSSPSNALTSNAAATSSGGSNSYTQALGMRGLSGYTGIPDSATISGIIIRIIMFNVNSFGSGNITGYFDLVKATDSRVGTQKTQSFAVGSGWAYSIGISNDMWGTSWTAADIKNSEFGVDVGFFYNQFYSVSIEQVYAEIFYTYTDSTGRRGVYSTVATLRTN